MAKVAAGDGRPYARRARLLEDLDVAGVFVKTPVFPFVRFPGWTRSSAPR